MVFRIEKWILRYNVGFYNFMKQIDWLYVLLGFNLYPADTVSVSQKLY